MEIDSFSFVCYIKVGNDLLDNLFSANKTYSYNESQTMADDSYLPTAERKAATRELLLRLDFQKESSEKDNARRRQAILSRDTS